MAQATGEADWLWARLRDIACPSSFIGADNFSWQTACSQTTSPPYLAVRYCLCSQFMCRSYGNSTPGSSLGLHLVLLVAYMTTPFRASFNNIKCDSCYVFAFLAIILHMSFVDFISLFLKPALASEECLINSFSTDNKNFLVYRYFLFPELQMFDIDLYTIRIKEKGVKFEI